LQLLDQAKANLLEAACRVDPAARFDRSGYALRLEDNMIDGVSRQLFEADYLAGAGRELHGKMRAVHSSAALVVNTFARWRERPATLCLAGATGFDSLRFEAVFPTGLGGTPPHLDLAAQGSELIAVESKFLEYLTPKPPVFSRSYDTIADSRRDSPWFALVDLLRREPARFRFLDAAQLVKHALGLMRSPAIANATLLYLYWEPLNPADFDEFQLHREEIACVQSMLGGARPLFRSTTYMNLWDDWRRRSADDAGLNTHLDRLGERYAIAIGAHDVR
jgi:hypothetical protein